LEKKQKIANIMTNEMVKSVLSKENQKLKEISLDEEIRLME